MRSSRSGCRTTATLAAVWPNRRRERAAPVTSTRGRPFPVSCTVRDGRIVALDVLAAPERLSALGLTAPGATCPAARIANLSTRRGCRSR
ncbi:hypothetical protein Acsp04_20960 [Actinomadura sp. NBRC 104425]|nr:hypothetical protein Acsp04_20960 [Actinomadura sp. NBRC 104425]